MLRAPTFITNLSRASSGIMLMCAVVFSAAGPLHAQCEAFTVTGNEFDGLVDALTPYNDNLLAGGSFTSFGNTTLNHIARWDGAAWQPMHTGMNGVVNALIIHNNQPIAAGNFTMASGQSAQRIARWNGVFWQPMSSGMNGPVRALTIFNGQLVAAGDFTIAGGVTVNRIARWDGAFWQPFGSGFNGPVHALAVYNNQLIAAGDFTTADGQPANRIARWIASAWSPLGAGMNTTVRSLAVFVGVLYAGGEFTTAGDVAANRIARWNGAFWSTASPEGMDAAVHALTVYGNHLIAGGDFSTAGGQSANRVARFNSATWSSLSDGIGAIVRSLAGDNTDLYVGGALSQTGFVARWQDGFTITQHPSSTLVSEGQSVQLSVSASGAFANLLTYQWSRDGHPLTDGGKFSGVTTPALTITNLTLSDFGAYDVLITSACGSVMSHPAAVGILPGVVEPTCPGDLNNSGVVDVQDLLILLSNWGMCR